MMTRNALPSRLLLVAVIPLVLAQAPSGGGSGGQNGPTPSDVENMKICKYIALTWAALVGVLLAYRWTLSLLRHVRQLANLNHGTTSDGRQRYFATPNERWATIKRYIIHAPLFRKRHNREFKLSAAANVGTVPSRLQSMFLVGYFILNVTLCGYSINWYGESMYVEARNRTGVLSVLNMIPLFLLAGRNNPLIWLLDIDFNTYNLMHRWIGRIAVLEAIAHTAFWMAGKLASMGTRKGWAFIRKEIAPDNALIFSGTIAVIAFIVLLLQSPSIVRHAFYETFLHIHIALAATAVVAVFVHLQTLPQQVFLITAMICWIIERAFRMIRLIRHNTGNGVTKAEVEALPGDAVRITLRIAKPWKFSPGQHVYLYMPSVGLWTSHPFSLAWSQDDSVYGEKGLPVARQDVLTARKTISMSLIARRRTGFTDKMWKKAEMSPMGKFVTTAFVEGPYGNQSFQSYGTVMLIAAGVGITHQVPHVRDLVAAYSNGTCATRKVILVWIIQSPEHLEWIRPWMTSILAMEKRRDILKILLFVTRPRSTKEIHSPSASVQMFPGKPDVGALIEKEQHAQVGAMAISVCGTGSLSDDVRKATRERCEKTEVDFFEESFSW